MPRVSHLNYPVAYSCNSINTPDTETSFLSPAPALYDFALVQINYYLCANLREYLSASAYRTHQNLPSKCSELQRSRWEQVVGAAISNQAFLLPMSVFPSVNGKRGMNSSSSNPSLAVDHQPAPIVCPRGGNAITSTASAVSRPLVPSSDARCQTRSSFDTGLCQGRHHSPTPLDPVPRLAIPVRQLLYPPSSLTTVRTA